MSETPKQSHFEEALKILTDETLFLFESEVLIPSLQIKVKLKELNGLQQKKLIDSSIDSTVSYNKNYVIKALFKTLQENLENASEIIDRLNIFDRYYFNLIF